MRPRMAADLRILPVGRNWNTFRSGSRRPSRRSRGSPTMRAAVLRNTGDEKLEVVDDIEADPTRARRGHDQDRGHRRLPLRPLGDDRHHPAAARRPCSATRAPASSRRSARASPSVQEGDHVIVAWSPPCGHCVNCIARKSPHLCTEIDGQGRSRPRFSMGDTAVFGMAGAGTFAEYMTMPAARARSRSTTTSRSRSPR